MMFATEPISSPRFPQRNTPFGILVVAHWKGERGLFAATLVPGALLIALSKVTDAVLHSRDWTYEYRSAGAIALVAFAMIAVVAIWGAIGAARTARRAEDYGEGIIRVYAGVSVVMAITLATAGQYGFSTWKYLAWAAEMARDDGKHIEIQVDKASARTIMFNNAASFDDP